MPWEAMAHGGKNPVGEKSGFVILGARATTLYANQYHSGRESQDAYHIVHQQGSLVLQLNSKLYHRIKDALGHVYDRFSMT